MNAKEKKIIEEKVIASQKVFREQLKLHDDGELTTHLAYASCALSELYEDLFGKEEFFKLMEKNFSEIFKD